MGLLTKLLRGDPQPRAAAASGRVPLNYDPGNDYWYMPPAMVSEAGVYVSPSLALQISAVYACVKLISESVASLPLHVYKRSPDGKGKTIADQNPLYEILHDRPNAWQTSFEYREMMMGHLLLRGNAYSYIAAGARGFVDELIPLNPDKMEVKALPGDPLTPQERALVYTYTMPDGHKEQWSQDEIFHLRGPSADGVCGMSTIALMKEAIGLSRATESFGARFFSQGGNPGGVLEHPAGLSDVAYERLQKTVRQDSAGLDNAHRWLILEEGMKWHQIGISNEDSQLLESRRFQVVDIARFFGVSPKMIGDVERGAQSADPEDEAQTYVTYTLRPWCVRLEQAIKRDLIAAPQTYFAEFLVDGLVRGNLAARSAAYTAFIGSGIMSPNEAREKENMEPREGGDVYKDINLGATGLDAGPGAGAPEQAPPPPSKKQAPPAPPADGEDPPAPPPPPSKKKQAPPAEDRSAQIVQRAAERLERTEQQEVARAAIQHARSEDDFTRWARGFYSARYPKMVAEVLCVGDEIARTYCEGRLGALIARGAGVLESGGAAALVRAALGEEG